MVQVQVDSTSGFSVSHYPVLSPLARSGQGGQPSGQGQKVEGQQLPKHCGKSHKSWGGAEAILGFGIVLVQCQCRIERIA